MYPLQLYYIPCNDSVDRESILAFYIEHAVNIAVDNNALNIITIRTFHG